MQKHLNITVQGRVQGVFFRASARAKAIDLGVVGFVKNKSDGSVYIEAEGEEKILEVFLNWCGQGPANAVVSLCEVTEGDVVNLKGFVIER